MEELRNALRAGIEGEVRFDKISKKIYSVDASIYEIEPTGVVLPRTKQDLIEAVKIAHSFGIPVVARGAATGIAGGCVGSGLIIDTSKYLTQLITIDFQNEYAVCEPGVVQDTLNDALEASGYRLGPDTSTGNRATIGGMLANNAAGARSLKYGKMSDHVEETELVTADGETLRLGPIDDNTWELKRSQNNLEGRIYSEIYRIRNQYRDEINKRFPQIPRRVSGYNLDEIIKEPGLNLSKLIAGSEGTLGIVTEVKVRIVPKPGLTAICILRFADMIEAMRSVPYLLSHHPISLEMIDDKIVALGRSSPFLKGKLHWLKDTPQALFSIEFEGRDDAQLREKTDLFVKKILEKGIDPSVICLSDPVDIAAIRTVRKSGLGLLLSKRTYARAIGFLEDISVAPDKLADFMERFNNYLKLIGKEAGIYGHVGSGCMHIRPYIDLRKPEELQMMHKMMEDVSDLLLAFGGALSGEHGDGLARSWLNKKMFGENINQAFIEVKKAFDPDNRMNPGKIVFPDDPSANLRLSPQTVIRNPRTFLDFSPEGGFPLAVDLCNGNGLCRKKDGVMCPSFQVTGDERDSTRARAQSLRAIVTGRLPAKAFADEGIKEILDLCIECKGCKTECPSQVDMAKMKAESLYHYQEKHGYSFRNKLFAHIDVLNRFGAVFPSLFNAISPTGFSKRLLGFMGITAKRDLPRLASDPFSSRFAKIRQPADLKKEVVLFNDTFTEFNEPEIGVAAVRVLNRLGYRVVVPPRRCCGRPMISKGFLEEARQKALALTELLYPYALRNVPVIGLEPSCILTVKDDFLSVLGSKNEKAARVISVCTTFDEFLAGLLSEGFPSFKESDREVKLHGHCHQKALVGTQPTLDVLRAIPGFRVSEAASGCCGMAGSFGYEAEHYDFSMKIGELRLFPAVRSSCSDTLWVANGFSCRTQIAGGTGRRAHHLAEVIEKSLL